MGLLGSYTSKPLQPNFQKAQKAADRMIAENQAASEYSFDNNIFYEKQLNNPATTWELLAQPWAEDGVKVKEGNDWTESIIRGIITDTSLAFSGNHDFSKPDGLLGSIGDKVNGLAGKFNDLSSTLSASKGLINDILKTANTGETVDSLVKTASNALGASNSLAGSAIKSFTDNIGSRVTTSFDYVKVFKGTGLDIQLPSLDARIYNNTFIPLTRNSHNDPNPEATGAPLSTKEFLTELFKRLVGEVSNSGTGTDSVFMVQKPPNGYIPSFKNMSATDIVDGTFMLKYGSYFIPNLLVSGFSVRSSSFKLREGKVTGSFLPSDCKATDQPLYVDVSISVMPATYVSRDLITKIFIKEC